MTKLHNIIYDFIFKDHKKEVDKLRETIKIQEEELRQLREDRQRWVRQQKEFGSTFDKTERTLVNEINEECRRTSEVLGLSPRKVNLTRFVQKYCLSVIMVWQGCFTF